MSIPLKWANGDRCLAFGRLGVIEEAYQGGMLHGLFLVRRPDGSTVMAARDDLDLAISEPSTQRQSKEP